MKDTLDLDTSEYSSFYGECYDQTLVSQWSLYWEGSTGTLSIDALEDGTISGYYLSQEEAGSAGLPSYPSGDPAQAKETAQAFLDKVLSPGLESVQLEESSGSDRLGRNQYRLLRHHPLPRPALPSELFHHRGRSERPGDQFPPGCVQRDLPGDRAQPHPRRDRPGGCPEPERLPVPEAGVRPA